MTITKQILDINTQYINTNPNIIKHNLIEHIKISKYARQSSYLADILNVDLQTIYSYRKPKQGNVPTFINALKLCEVLNITIQDLMKDNKTK